MRFSFAAKENTANCSGVNPNEQANALESARRAGIDLSLVDSNLALTVKERWLKHDEAVEKVRVYEATVGATIPDTAIIRRIKSGVELLLKVSDGYEVKRIC